MKQDMRLRHMIVRLTVFVLSALMVVGISTLILAGKHGSSQDKDQDNHNTAADVAHDHQDHTKDDKHKKHKSKHKHEDDSHHKLHKAHIHGIAQLQVVVDQSHDVHFHMAVPLEVLVGFEHKPKTKEQQELLDTAEQIFKDPTKFLQFKDGMKCKEVLADYALYYKGSHAEAKYTLQMKCESDVSSQSVSIVIGKQFKRMKEIHLKLIPMNGTASSTVYKKFPFDIKL